MNIKEVKKKLAREVRHRRLIELDISQGELAKKSGVGITTIKNLEREKANPTLDTIERLARAFNIQIEDLLCFNKHKKREGKKNE